MMSGINYIEEQTNELQALESMYPNELEILSTQPPITFNIRLTTDDYMDNEIRLTVELQFVLPAKYPDELPTVEIVDFDHDFEESHKTQLLQLLQAEMPDHVGMVMIFTLVSFASEWLMSQVEGMKQAIQDEADTKLREHEELERKKFEGTRVTLENFMAWKANYDAETGRTAAKQVKDANKKLTGRQLFERDASLANSDLAFIKDGEGVEGVSVDETLFQDLEDLDLEEDDGSEFDPNDLDNDSD